MAQVEVRSGKGTKACSLVADMTRSAYEPS